jgi:hypothetical protein
LKPKVCFPFYFENWIMASRKWWISIPPISFLNVYFNRLLFKRFRAFANIVISHNCAQFSDSQRDFCHYFTDAIFCHFQVQCKIGKSELNWNNWENAIFENCDIHLSSRIQQYRFWNQFRFLLDRYKTKIFLTDLRPNEYWKQTF